MVIRLRPSIISSTLPSCDVDIVLSFGHKPGIFISRKASRSSRTVGVQRDSVGNALGKQHTKYVVVIVLVPFAQMVLDLGCAMFEVIVHWATGKRLADYPPKPNLMHNIPGSQLPNLASRADSEPRLLREKKHLQSASRLNTRAHDLCVRF